MITSDDKTIYSFVERQCRINPHASAIEFDNICWSYGELDAYINELKYLLSHTKFQMCSPVAIYAEKSPKSIAAIFAVSALGGTFVPINPALKKNQIERILKDCRANILVIPYWNHAKFNDLSIQNSELSVINIDNIYNGVESLSEKPDNVLCASDCLVQSKSSVSATKCSQDIAAILYTSGSTGFPKGVMLSHRNLLEGTASVLDYLNITSEDKILALLPISFDYGLNQITTAFSAGATIVLMNYLIPRDTLNLVVTHQITGIAAVPHVWAKLAALSWPTAATKSLRYITNSGGPISKSLSSKLQQILEDTSIYLMYGFTEAFRSTYLPPDMVHKKPNSIGLPIPGAEVYISRKNGEQCNDNETGELIHGGPHVSLGYYNNIEATNNRFFTKSLNGDLVRFARSGDLAYRDSDGYFHFVARDSELIKTMGYRVSPYEVESVLLDNPLVFEVCAVGVEQDDDSEIILVVLTKSHSLSLADLRQFCIKEMPSYMIPTDFVTIEDFPLNQNGKIDKETVKQIANDHHRLNIIKTSDET